MLKFGIIGTSWITDTYIEGAQQSGLWQLSAIYSRTKEKGLEFGEKYGVSNIFTDLSEFAKSSDFSAVYVASPNVFHYEQCKVLLENGKHVICEKPMVSYDYQIKELFEIADKNKLIFMEAIMFMHMPLRHVLKSALKKIGHISMSTLDFCKRSSKLDGYLSGTVPNTFNPDMQAGSLMDLGVYCLFPAFYLFGEPITYNICDVKIDTGVDILGIINFVYKDKLVSMRFSKYGEAAANTDIQGVDGTISIESISLLENMSIKYKDGNEEILSEIQDKNTLMGYEAISFYNFITNLNGNEEHYEECKNISILVNAYLQKFRKDINLPF